MNRALIITTGIVIILLVLGVWIYLMLFGTPEDTEEVFTNLGFNLPEQQTTVDTLPLPTKTLETLVDTGSDTPLQQLTTRPVAGFTFASTTEGKTIRYIERGTGHIYEILLATGQERLISGTTIPKVSKAFFSPTGNTVALVTYNNYLSDVFVGTLSDDTNIIGINLQPGAENISFTSDDEVLYTLYIDGRTVGYSHNIHTLVQRELFSVEYKNLNVTWGAGINAIYLTTKPAAHLEGFMYTINGTTLTPIDPSAYGLSALFSNQSILATYIENNHYVSTAITDTSQKRLPVLTLREKCVFDTYNKNFVWCAAPMETVGNTFVEDWYKGTISLSDHLWLINIDQQTAELYASPKEESGRMIDVKEIHINDTGNMLSFINKRDQTLWLYDLTKR